MTEQSAVLSSGSLETAGAFIVKLNAMRDGGISGEVYAVYQKKSARVSGLDEAVLVINDWLEEEKLQPDGIGLRRFSAKRRAEREADADREREPGPAGSGEKVQKTETFLIRVLYRQHTSWQGEVTWKRQRVYFRSCLELMALIRSALTAEEPERGGPRSRKRPAAACIL